MPSIVVHFPDGDKEFRLAEREPEEGDLVSHDGDRFRVVSVRSEGERCTVVVEKVEEGLLDLLESERGVLELTLDPS